MLFYLQASPVKNPPAGYFLLERLGKVNAVDGVTLCVFTFSLKCQDGAGRKNLDFEFLRDLLSSSLMPVQGKCEECVELTSIE